MMRLPVFEYLRPRELGEACEMLAEHGDAAAVVAGGTDLFPKLKRRQIAPTVLVGLHAIEELRGVDVNGGISMRASTRISEVAAHPAFTGPYSALAKAAGMIASPQIRNAGTVGGNLCLDVRCDFYDRPQGWRDALGGCLRTGADVCRLASGGCRCWAVSTSDLAPVTLALDGTVRLVGPSGERQLSAGDLYRDDGQAHLTVGPDEIVTELRLPPANGLRATYLKLRRRGSIDFPLVSAAVAVRLDEEGTCTYARVALGAVASLPVRAVGAEELLVGRAFDDDAIAEAAEAAGSVAKPMNNTDLTPGYRKRMVRVYVSRALAELAADGAGA
jgi:4-hydroxybenzoyl-CoA reductase subunit beta